MKIISNFKDYYDFVVFETDNRKTYERKMKNIGRFSDLKIGEEYKECIDYILTLTMNLNENDPYFIGVVCFCDQNFAYIFDIEEEKYYYRYDDIPVNIKNKINKKLHSRSNINLSLENIFQVKQKNKKGDWFDHFDFNRIKEKQQKKYNSKSNCPIIFSRLRNKMFEEICINGRLKDIDFTQVKTPSEAYTDIYNFIPYNEPIIDLNPDDMNRYESKGFDKKTSFRKQK